MRHLGGGHSPEAAAATRRIRIIFPAQWEASVHGSEQRSQEASP